MRTKPPCKVDGVDCEKRRVGCKSDCLEWNRWVSIHEAERNAANKQKQDEIRTTDFLVTSKERARKRNQSKAESERRKGIR